VTVEAQNPTSFPSATNLTPSIQTKVTESGNVLTYSYSVSNSPSSKQALGDWGFGYQQTISIFITMTPAGWLGNPKMGDSFAAGWTALSQPISPSGNQSGFQVEAQGLPGFVQAFAAGYIPLEKLPAFPDDQAPEDLPGSDILENSVKITTIGPTPLPSQFDSLQFLKYIIGLKEQAFTLGWISNGGVKTSLDAKLNAAQTALNNGNQKEAKNQLNALLNEVNAQAGKQLSSEAVALLQFNTQYLISQLP